MLVRRLQGAVKPKCVAATRLNPAKWAAGLI
jgi:hypothetical protein